MGGRPQPEYCTEYKGSDITRNARLSGPQYKWCCNGNNGLSDEGETVTPRATESSNSFKAGSLGSLKACPKDRRPPKFWGDMPKSLRSWVIGKLGFSGDPHNLSL